MKITTSITTNMETGEVLAHQFYEYSGPVDLACGASSGQKGAFRQAQKVSQSLSTDFQQIFGDNENILKSVTDALEPIVAAGPNQYGFNAGEDSAMRTQATDTLAAAGRNATNATRSALASQGGGNTLIPSGSEAAIEGSLAEDQANKQAEAQLAITKSGYDTGRANFLDAEGRLVGAPGALESPAISAGEAAMGASQQNIQDQTQLTDLNNAWVAPLTGAIGGATKALTGLAV